MKITVYTSPTCGNCMLLKDILDEHGYEYEEIDITSDKIDVKELGINSGCGGIPVIERDGKYFCGFNEDAVLDFLM